METEINLNNYRSHNARVFSGRDRGEAVRSELSETLKAAKNYDKIVVVIPHDVMSLNDSFFLGLFGTTVRDLGEEKFKRIFEFHCSDMILKDIEAAIKQATKEKKVI